MTERGGEVRMEVGDGGTGRDGTQPKGGGVGRLFMVVCQLAQGEGWFVNHLVVVVS